MIRARLAGPIIAALLAVTGCGAQSAAPAGPVGQAAPPPPVETAAPAPSPAESQPEPALPPAPVEVQTTTIATGLEAPWGLAFLPDGRALVTERDSGRLLAVDAAGTVTEVQQLPSVAGGEGGLLGIDLSPTYAEDGLVYVYYSTAEDNRVARFRLGEEPQPILTGIPRSPVHNGGRIAFGPDGYLYIGGGDAREAELAQDPASLAGKILRVTADGQPAPGNPIPGNPLYSLGHRNVQGLAWDAAGQLYATEFGANTADEVNLIQPGGNYGWPIVEGVGGGEEFIDPIITFDPDEASPSGATFLVDGAIPQWEGDLFFAALRGQRLWRLDFADGGLAGTEQLLVDEYGRLRHVAQAPDGSLWILTSNRDGRGDPVPEDDRILRLGPPS